MQIAISNGCMIALDTAGRLWKRTINEFGIMTNDWEEIEGPRIPASELPTPDEIESEGN